MRVACDVVCVFAYHGAGNAAATSPARGGGRLAASAPRSAITRLRSGSRPSPCIPPPRAGSAKGGGIPRPAHSVSAEPGYGRRCGARGALRPLRALRFARGYPPLRSGAFPAPVDSCGAPRPHAARSAVARLGRNTSRRRIGGISLASVRVSRRHRLRLVPPPILPALLLLGADDGYRICTILPMKITGRLPCRICACRSTKALGITSRLRLTLHECIVVKK